MKFTDLDLDPKVLNKIGNLELNARRVVAGFIAGMHKSPYRGFSVEFAENSPPPTIDDIMDDDEGRSFRINYRAGDGRHIPAEVSATRILPPSSSSITASNFSR